MSIKLKIYSDTKDLIDVFNFLDQRNIDIEFDQDHLFQNFVDEEKYDEIEFFIDRGTDIITFMKYCTEKNDNVVNFLAEKNAELSDNPGEFLVNLINNKSFDSAMILINSYKGDTKEFVNYENGSPLLTAANKGHKELARLLLMKGAKISLCLNDPIVNALTHNSFDLIDLLIDYGSCVKNIMPSDFVKCLNNKYDKPSIYISKLLENNKLSHFRKHDLTSCLEEAARFGNVDIMRTLINYIGGINKYTAEKLMKMSRTNVMVGYLNCLKNGYTKKPSGDGDDGSDDSDDSNNEFNHYSGIKIGKYGISF